MSRAAASIQDLRARIRALEGGFGEPSLRRHVPTGIAALDARLAGGGLPAGALVVVVAAKACARGATEMPWALAVLLAAAVLRAAQTLGEYTDAAPLRIRGSEAVLVDRAGDLYAPGLAALGLPLERTLLVRPQRARDAPWAFAEALRSRAVAVTVGELARPGAADLTRLTQAAEEGGGVGIALVREAEEAALARAPAILRVRSLPEARGPDPPGGPRYGVRIARSRGGGAVEPGEEIEVHVTQDLVYDVAGAHDGHRDAGRAVAQG